MILTDTSVVIDFLRGLKNDKVEIFEAVLKYDLILLHNDRDFYSLAQHLTDLRTVSFLVHWRSEPGFLRSFLYMRLLFYVHYDIIIKKLRRFSGWRCFIKRLHVKPLQAL